ncbi:MAG: hypothetical protein EOP56_18085 [Sphingobacteriales bacterium]|nr:MAG: hypothetical protein EOP56_18085 [Sphingobacteriales bacterium]
MSSQLNGEVLGIIRELTKNNVSKQNAEIYRAEVVSVDVKKRTCTVISYGIQEMELPDVKLMPVVDDGLLLVPAIDSEIYIATTAQNGPFVVQYSELQAVYITVGNVNVKIFDGNIMHSIQNVAGNGKHTGAKAMQEITPEHILQQLGSAFIKLMADGVQVTGKSITLNGNNYGGLVIADKVADGDNAIKDDLNTLKAAIVSGHGGGAGYTPATIKLLLDGLALGWGTQALAPTVSTDLQNKTVKHGNK